jgi:uncharacterized integral membrane protein
MKSILRIIVFVPLGLIILFFAMANRGSVKISLDPFPGADLSGPSFEAPLFLIVLASMALGVLAGGVSSWLGHMPVRRAAKVARVDARKARDEAELLRQAAMASLPAEEGHKGE